MRNKMPEEARRSLEKPGEARKSPKEPGEAQRSPEKPGEARRSPEKPGKPWRRKYVIFQKYFEVIFLLRASSFEESVTFGLVK